MKSRIIMAGRAVKRPRVVSVLSVGDASSPQAIADSMALVSRRRERDVKQVDLIIGTNRVRHGLGRPAVGYTITPTFLTIAFGHAINTTNPHPELEVWIDTVGSDQFKAMVEIW